MSTATESMGMRNKSTIDQSVGDQTDSPNRADHANLVLPRIGTGGTTAGAAGKLRTLE